MFLDVVFWILIALLILSFVRAVIGPMLWDRLVAMNLITVKGILIIIIHATREETISLLDVVLVYALFSFISSIFLALFISEYKARGEKK